jgi:hypothetical protein
MGLVFKCQQKISKWIQSKSSITQEKYIAIIAVYLFHGFVAKHQFSNYLFKKIIITYNVLLYNRVKMTEKTLLLLQIEDKIFY